MRSGIILCSVRQMEMAYQRQAAVKWVKRWVNDSPEHIRKPIIEDAIQLFRKQGKTCHYEDLCLHIYTLKATDQDTGQELSSSLDQLPSDSSACQSQDEHDPSTL